jgi:hypothetical protein
MVPEIVGNVLARHRQLERLRGSEPLGHFEQEAGHPLLRALDEQHHVLLDATQLTRCERPQLVGGLAITLSKRHHRGAPDHHHRGVVDRLCRELVLLADLEPENVARQIEGADLAAAVVEDLVGPHRALDDLVDVFGRLILAEDLLVRTEAHLAAQQLHGTEPAERGSRAARRIQLGLAGNGGAKLGLHQHGLVSLAVHAARDNPHVAPAKIQIMRLSEGP